MEGSPSSLVGDQEESPGRGDGSPRRLLRGPWGRRGGKEGGADTGLAAVMVAGLVRIQGRTAGTLQRAGGRMVIAIVVV